MATTGEKIRQAYTQKGISQHKLAQMIGSEQTRISKIVLGKKKPRNDTIKKIADALEVEVRQLAGDEIIKEIEGEDMVSKIKKRCLDKGITYSQLANISGVSLSAVMSILRKRNVVSRITTIKSIAKALDIPLSELLEDDSYSKKGQS